MLQGNDQFQKTTASPAFLEYTAAVQAREVVYSSMKYWTKGKPVLENPC